MCPRNSLFRHQQDALGLVVYRLSELVEKNLLYSELIGAIGGAGSVCAVFDNVVCFRYLIHLVVRVRSYAEYRAVLQLAEREGVNDAVSG